MNYKMKYLLVILIFALCCSACGHKSPLEKKMNSLSLDLKKKSSEVDSVQQIMSTFEKRDDSLFNAIKNGNLYPLPDSTVTIDYNLVMSDYNSFKERYKAYLTMNELPVKLPLSVIQNSKIIGFGKKLHPIFNKTVFHNGIDLPAQKGTPVFSTINGSATVSKSPREGNKVSILNDNKIKVVFSHLDSVYVKDKDVVKTGQLIGTVGSTGMSTGNHLHYSVLINDEPVNPLFFIFDSFSRNDLEFIFGKNNVSLD
jgi:murein DD-endopeptidase MepM/ murein hydrolase activator NlpD